MSDDPPPVQVNIPTPPAVFGERQAGTKKKAKSMQPTFLGTGSIPEVTNLGQKTLLGQ